MVHQEEPESAIREDRLIVRVPEEILDLRNVFLTVADGTSAFARVN